MIDIQNLSHLDKETMKEDFEQLRLEQRNIERIKQTIQEKSVLLDGMQEEKVSEFKSEDKQCSPFADFWLTRTLSWKNFNSSSRKSKNYRKKTQR